MRCLVSLLLVLALSGCSMVKPILPSCDDPQPYQGSAEIASLKVPEGVDSPNTRTALKIPEVKAPQQPPQAGKCLEEPPVAPSRSASAGAVGATAAAGSPAAGSTVPLPSAGGGMSVSMGADRRWETRLGVLDALSQSVEFEGGTRASFHKDLGFLVGGGYHMTESFEVGGNFYYNRRDYNASVAGDEPGEVFPVEGSIDSMSVMLDLTYSFLSGPLRPFLVGGVGWNWVDTNIATEPPSIGCWWDPWYGYICTTFQDTKSVDGLVYQLGAGLTYQLSEAFSLSGSYRVNWVDFPKAAGSPKFDAVQLNLGWRF